LAPTLHSQRQQRIISAYKQLSCKLVAVMTAEPSYYINYAITVGTAQLRSTDGRTPVFGWRTDLSYARPAANGWPLCG